MCTCTAHKMRNASTYVSQVLNFDMNDNRFWSYWLISWKSVGRKCIPVILYKHSCFRKQPSCRGLLLAVKMAANTETPLSGQVREPKWRRAHKHPNITESIRRTSVYSGDSLAPCSGELCPSCICHDDLVCWVDVLMFAVTCSHK
jgi:hypothetical protein